MRGRHLFHNWYHMRWVAAGPVLYALDWPEKRHPRVFGIFGASHQLMHVCVLVAALMHGWCMQRARELRPVVAPCEGE